MHETFKWFADTAGGATGVQIAIISAAALVLAASIPALLATRSAKATDPALAIITADIDRINRLAAELAAARADVERLEGYLLDNDIDPRTGVRRRLAT